MIKIPITFQSPEDAVEFVNLVNKYDCDVDLRYGHHTVDAKSLMGTLSMSSVRSLEMMIHDNDCMDLVQKVGKFVTRRSLASSNSYTQQNAGENL